MLRPWIWSSKPGSKSRNQGRESRVDTKSRVETRVEPPETRVEQFFDPGLPGRIQGRTIESRVESRVEPPKPGSKPGSNDFRPWIGRIFDPGFEILDPGFGAASVLTKPCCGVCFGAALKNQIRSTSNPNPKLCQHAGKLCQHAGKLRQHAGRLCQHAGRLCQHAGRLS